MNNYKKYSNFFTTINLSNHSGNGLFESNNKDAKTINENLLPKVVTLAWTSLSIKAHFNSYLELPNAILNKKIKRKRTEIILNKTFGIVESGTLFALMGPRYTV